MAIIEESGRVRVRTFTQTNVSGTYTATVPIPAGAVVRDVQFSNQVLWNADTSAGLIVGDADDADGYFTGVSVLAAPAADVAGAGGISSFDGDAGAGAYSGFAKRYPTGGTITAVITAVDGAGTNHAGRSTLVVYLDLYAPAIAATKA